MAEDVSNKELYNIINRAISKWGCFDDVAIDKEINIFSHKYDLRRKNNPQIDIFEDSIPSPEDVAQAKQMCSDLQKYNSAIDIYTGTIIEYSESFYRQLYSEIERYASNISEDNQIRYKLLRQSLQKKIPEFEETILIEQYKQDIHIIENLKKTNKSECQTKASIFFNLITNKEGKISDKVKNLTTTPEKILLCERIIGIVDCLSSDKYSRSTKFTLKRDLYSLMSETAESLGEFYKQTTQVAKKEAERFQKAIDNTKKFMQKPKKKFLSFEELNKERNKKAMDEWLYI